MTNHYIAWWNLENLFDAEDAPPERRPDYLAERLASVLKDWTAEVLDKKIAQLAWVIKQMNGGEGPEVEVPKADWAKIVRAQLDRRRRP